MASMPPAKKKTVAAMAMNNIDPSLLHLHGAAQGKEKAKVTP